MRFARELPGLIHMVTVLENEENEGSTFAACVSETVAGGGWTRLNRIDLRSGLREAASTSPSTT